MLDQYRLLLNAREPFTISLDVESERISLPDDDLLSVNTRDLPWELLYDKKAGPLAENNIIRLVRVDEPTSTPSWKPTTALRVLVALSQPTEVLARMYEEWPGGQPEYDALIQQIMDATRQQAITFVRTLTDSVTLRALKAEMSDAAQPYDVLHLIGHADALGKIAFAGDAGEATAWEEFGPVGSEFQELVYSHKAPILVFLHLCRGPSQLRQSPRGPTREFPPDLMRGSFTGLAYELLTAGVPIVVAMQYPMSPDVGQQFTKAFYESVAGHTVAEAVQKARLKIEPKSSRLGPVLFLGGPDGTIVEVPRSDNRSSRSGSATKVPFQLSTDDQPTDRRRQIQVPRPDSSAFE